MTLGLWAPYILSLMLRPQETELQPQRGFALAVGPRTQMGKQQGIQKLDRSG